MGALTLYVIKSSIVLALLYLPYTLLLRKETFHAFNRVMLISIVVVSLVVPCIDVPGLMPSSPVGEAINNVVMLPTLVIGVPLSSPDGESAPPLGEAGWGLWVVLINIIGMLACLLWKLIGLVRLVRFIPRGCLWTDEQEGATVYCHAGYVSPFSWMRSIVIGEEDPSLHPLKVEKRHLTSREGWSGSFILMHELAHVRMFHSWDTLFLSVVEVLQWFNPCIWMLDASLREVHEYEADDAVLRRGISARDYQLLLIEKAVERTPYPMVNAFRHSLLKNRITMMTKKKSPRWARLKVLYAVPLTLIALGAFASREVKEKIDPLTFINNKRVTKDDVKRLDQKQIAHIEVLQSEPAQKLFGEEAKEGAIMITTEEHKTLKPVTGTLRLVVDGKEMTPQEAVKAVEKKDITIAYIEHENKAFVSTTSTGGDDDILVDKPEVLPEFPGGQGEMWSWISKNIKYPQEALDYGVEGRVYIQFVVEKNGSISNIKPITGPGGRAVVVTAYKAGNDTPEELKKEGEDKGLQAMQQEAMRVVKAMPKWTPGREKGKPVRTKFVLPIMFRLS